MSLVQRSEGAHSAPFCELTVRKAAIALVVTGIARSIIGSLVCQPLLLPSYIMLGTGGFLFLFSSCGNCMHDLAGGTAESVLDGMIQPDKFFEESTIKSVHYPDRLIDFEKSVQEELEEMGLVGLPKDVEELQHFVDELMLSSAETRSDRGVLIYGPPGTGKTTLAKYLGQLLARRLNIDPKCVKHFTGIEIGSAIVGKTEKNILELFRVPRTAWEKYGEEAPTYIVKIDEIDALLSKRVGGDSGVNAGLEKSLNSIVSMFLGAFEGLDPCPNLIIIGCTNRRDDLDPALLRPGRFGIQLELKLPSTGKETAAILNHYLTSKQDSIHMDHGLDGEDVISLLRGFSGADIEKVVAKAVQIAKSEALRELRRRHDDGAGFSRSAISDHLKNCRLTKDILKQSARDLQRRKDESGMDPDIQASMYG